MDSHGTNATRKAMQVLRRRPSAFPFQFPLNSAYNASAPTLIPPSLS